MSRTRNNGESGDQQRCQDPKKILVCQHVRNPFLTLYRRSCRRPIAASWMRTIATAQMDEPTTSTRAPDSTTCKSIG
jgi:hypothetical protein